MREKTGSPVWSAAGINFEVIHSAHSKTLVLLLVQPLGNSANSLGYRTLETAKSDVLSKCKVMKLQKRRLSTQFLANCLTIQKIIDCDQAHQ